MRTWTIALIAVAAIVVVVFASKFMNGGVSVEAATARRGSIAEFVEERGKTRLPQTYNVTMPFDARIAPIDLLEGATVKKDQVVAQVLPTDLQLNVEEATAAVDRLKASIVENDDASVESTGLKQSLNFVTSMDRTVDAARERVKAGSAKQEYASSNLSRIQRMRQTNAATEDDLERAKVEQVQASVDYQQDLLVLRAMEAMQAATALMPIAVKQYIDRKVLTHEVLENQLHEAEVQLKEAQRDQKRGDLKSPVDGVVLDRAKSDEQQATAGTVLLKIGRMEDLEVEADILSQDVVNVKQDDDVEITGPAIGPTPARGKVVRIYPAGFTKTSSLGVEQQRVKVIIGFNAEDLARLRSERGLGVDYRVRVKVFTVQKDNALVVPRSSLFRGGDGGWQLFAISDGKAKLQPVKIGLMNDESAEITDGIKPEDQVILAPETSLRDGLRVKPIVREQRAAQNVPAGD
jgi:HlyD family secretion protein